jgi:hypothetical protein
MLFGASFRSTIIRPSAFMALVAILAFLVSLLLPASEASEFQRLGAVSMIFLAALGIFGNAILGSWIGWGVAHWRFPTRPQGVWPFWLWPAASGGILYGAMMIVLTFLLDTVGTETISSTEKISAVAFATAFGPFFGIMGAAFFRYVPYATVLGSGRESGVAS